METFVIKCEQLNLPEKMAKKLMGKEVKVIETQEGILLKPIEDPIKDARGSLKGCRFSSERYMRLKKEEKELER